MFKHLEAINRRPKPFESYTAEALWTDPHTAAQMLSCHLNPDVDLSSRRHSFIERSVEWIVEHFGVGNDTRIADFGCGPGLYANRLAKLGAKVTGIDFSQHSLDHAAQVAKEAGLSVDLVHQNYLEFQSTKRFDLIMMIMCDFCALSPEQRAWLLQNFAAHLAPGGAVLLDAYSLAAFDGREELASYEANQLQGFWSPHRYYGFLNVFKYDGAKVVLDKYTIIEPERTRTVYNWLQYFSLEAITDEFAQVGLSVEEHYGDVAGGLYDEARDEFAVVARRA
jgi:cyclopropane fatty-acyl-phospholipid synthase-like methyltransferase